jgi:hypothetical protein
MKALRRLLKLSANALNRTAMTAFPDPIQTAPSDVNRAETQAAQRESATALLSQSGVEFSSHGAAGGRLIIRAGQTAIDFWPGTGRWTRRSDKLKGRGVESLLRLLKESQL